MSRFIGQIAIALIAAAIILSIIGMPINIVAVVIAFAIANGIAAFGLTYLVFVVVRSYLINRKGKQ